MVRRVVGSVVSLVFVVPAMGGVHAPPVAAAPQAAAAPAAALAEVVPVAHVEVMGTGPVPMILVPGLGADYSMWDGFAERNRERYTMYAVTLPGFGSSAGPKLAEGSKPSDLTWLLNAERAIADLVVQRGLDKPVLVGHSLGGYLAFRLAATKPELFRSVVVVDGLAAFPLTNDPTQAVPIEQRRTMVDQQMAVELANIPDPNWTESMRQMAGGWIADGARATAIGEMLAAVPAAHSKRYLLELYAADATEDVKTITIPVLAIAAIAPPEIMGMSEETQRLMRQAQVKDAPKVQLVYFENTRHFVTEDAPAELDRAIEQFLAGKPVEGKGSAAPAPPAEGKP